MTNANTVKMNRPTRSAMGADPNSAAPVSIHGRKPQKITLDSVLTEVEVQQLMKIVHSMQMS